MEQCAKFANRNWQENRQKIIHKKRNFIEKYILGKKLLAELNPDVRTKNVILLNVMGQLELNV